MTKKLTSRRLVTLILTLLMLLSVAPTTAFASSPSIRGYSSYAQTVYTGPSSSLYTSIGSISQNELIYILGTEDGWYHIVYNVNSGGQKSGYVPISSIHNVYGGTPVEDSFWGGYVMSNSTQRVYSCDDYSTKIDIGSVSANEGVTKLYGYNATASNGQVYPVYFVEYSTSSGTKRGYIFYPDFTEPIVTTVGRVTTNCNLVYGFFDAYNYWDGYSFGTSGSVYAGELVCVVAKNGNYMQIEYNTKQGRKRGYISSSYVSMYNNSGLYFPDLPFFYNGGSSAVFNYPTNIRSDPSDAYPIIDTQSGNLYFFQDDLTFNNYKPIQYLSDGVIKSGYIR